jgi:hypothetical protein
VRLLGEPRATWRAPIGATSSEKEKFIRKAYEAAILPSGKYWGGYAFLWGQKQRAQTSVNELKSVR